MSKHKVPYEQRLSYEEFFHKVDALDDRLLFQFKELFKLYPDRTDPELFKGLCALKDEYERDVDALESRIDPDKDDRCY